MAGHNKNIDKHCAQITSGLVGFALHQPPEDILNISRGTVEIAAARQMAMYLTYVGYGMSLTRVAWAFDRDRSTVAHACHRIEDRRDDAAFDHWMNGLEDVLRKLTPLCEQSKT